MPDLTCRSGYKSPKKQQQRLPHHSTSEHGLGTPNGLCPCPSIWTFRGPSPGVATTTRNEFYGLWKRPQVKIAVSGNHRSFGHDKSSYGCQMTVFKLQRFGRTPLRDYDVLARGSNGHEVLYRWMYCSHTAAVLRAPIACKWITSASIFTIHIFPASPLACHATCHGAPTTVGA
jgi:hypothetical protein